MLSELKRPACVDPKRNASARIHKLSLQPATPTNVPRSDEIFAELIGREHPNEHESKRTDRELGNDDS
jgi:hypothetical protein